MKNFSPWVNGKPAIENRVVHIDLKGPKIPFESLKKFLKLLARWGINGVLVEYEHRFPFLPLKYQFPESERYTKSQIIELVKFADDNGIQWIPLFQTFGHLEYLSRVKGTSCMFERHDYIQQICPLNEDARKYIERLIEIACEFHSSSKYIHVGQDETFQLGYCPECRKKVGKIGRMNFYLEHTMWVWNLVKKCGKIPMFWNDMFFTENNIKLLSIIDPDVIPVVWEYQDMGKSSYFVNIGGTRPTKNLSRNPYESIVNARPVVSFVENGKFFEDLPEEIKNLIKVDENGYPESFSQVKITAKYNKNFWATCAVYNCSDMLFMPDFVRGVLNPVSMCDTVCKLSGKGIIASSWARAHSYAPISPPWTLTLYNLAYFAFASYTGKTKPCDLKEISGVIADEINMPSKFGEFSLSDILWVISNQAPGPGVIGRVRNLENILICLNGKNITGIFGKGLLLSIEAETLYTKLLFLQEEARWWNSTKKQIPSMIQKEMRERFEKIKKNIRNLKSRAKQYYVENVGDKKSFETWWKGLFEIDLYLTEKAINYLKNF